MDFDASSVLVAHVEQGHLADFAQVAATLDGCAPVATCFQRPSSPGTGIDFLFGNSLCTQAFMSFRVLAAEECTIPTHRALSCTLNVGLALQEVMRLRRAAPLLFEKAQVPEEELRLANHHVLPILESMAEEWRAAMSRGCSDTAFHLFNRACEKLFFVAEHRYDLGASCCPWQG